MLQKKIGYFESEQCTILSIKSKYNEKSNEHLDVTHWFSWQNYVSLSFKITCASQSLKNNEN